MTFRMSGVEVIAMARGSLQQDNFDKEVAIANGWSFIDGATLHNKRRKKEKTFLKHPPCANSYFLLNQPFFGFNEGNFKKKV